MSLRFLPRRLTVFALLAFLLASGLPPTVAAAEPGQAYRPGGRAASAAGERFKDLDAAVESGALDASVLDGLRDRGAVEAIVTFDGAGILANAARGAPKGPGRAEAIIAAVRPGFAAQKRQAFERAGQGARVLQEYENLAASFVRFGAPGALLRVLNDAAVTGVRENHRYKATLNESLPVVGRTTQTSPAETGLGTEVAVLDTGVNYLLDTDAFGDCSGGPATGSCKVNYARDFTAVDDGRLDDDAPLCNFGCHGTNVAAVVLGVAPGTRILALDVFEDDGYAYDAAINRALNWLVGRKATRNVRAANLSLGAGIFPHTCWTMPQAPAFASLRAVGVLPVAASGNAAFNTGEYRNGIANPACVPGAVSVGAVYDDDLGGDPFSCGHATTGPDKVICFSQASSSLSVLAPGAWITAAGITMAGTSQATPHVAGTVAVLAEKHPTASAYQLQRILETTGTPVVDDRRSAPNTTNRLDLTLALAAPLPAKPIWADPPLTVGSPGILRWTYWSSLALTATSTARYLHNVRMSGETANTGVEFMRSANHGGSWAMTKRLNPTSQIGDFAVTASSGTYVYTAWMRWGTVYPYNRVVQFRANTLHGHRDKWLTTISLSPGSGHVDPPAIAASGAYVYVAWTDSATGNIRFRRSSNRGLTWSSPITIGTTTVTNDAGAWGTPVLSASGSYVGVAWLANKGSALRTYGLKARVSSNRGSSWAGAVSLDSDATDRPALAATASRLAFVWTDSGAVRLRVWNGGAWLTSAPRTVASLETSTWGGGYSPAVATFGTGTVEVVWTARRAACVGNPGTCDRDLLWRRSTNNGSAWATGPTVLVDSRLSENRRVNDAADIEFAGSSRRHIVWNGYTLDSGYVLYQLNGG